MSNVRWQGLPQGKLSRDEAIRQIPFAAAVALTRTAKKIEKDGVRLMRLRFTDPRPFTLKSQRVKPATKRKLVAETFFRTAQGRNIPARKYLEAQVEGGQRAAKRHEVELRSKGVLKPGEFTTPVNGGPFDHNRPRLGNQYRRLASGIQRPGLRVPRGDATGSGRRAASFFRAGDLIIQRSSKRKTRAALHIVSSASYRPIFGWGKMAVTTTRRHLPLEMRKAMRQALATAR
ncbi:MAG: hypothetical protein AAFR84_02920 [Pseudomonadota bacterium]